ncbi:MAG TPA: TldD/PmbA family protein [Candidatus Binataceae bacterium]|jgi:TldD protein|nr:TldD/PmbA family protein [Candidatus Binataceae bacterium]
MANHDLFEAVDFLRRDGEELLRRFARAHRGTAYADLRFEVVFHRSCVANDGEPRESLENESASFGVTVWVDGSQVAAARGTAGFIGTGQYGAELGRLAMHRNKLVAALRAGLNEAYQRARSSARAGTSMRRRLGAELFGSAAAAGVGIAPVRDDVAAVFRDDPRTLDPEALKRIAREASAATSGVSSAIVYNGVAALSELRRELFVSTDGTAVTQAFAFSQGDCYVVAETAHGHQETYDTIGQQRGCEVLTEGCVSELQPNPNLASFALAMAREAVELADAPVLRAPGSEVTVVTDPHFNALVAHEIVGHPSEADRALKMEAAYAGRSWLLRSPARSEIGMQIGAPMLSACSDPTLDGYGFYRYDHEGTPGRRVMHIDHGIFRGFLNSRATAAILAAEPNGSARATAACYMPLIRMSNTFFMPGADDPAQIIGEVEHGYYVCGSQIPSIAESRENFRISARRVYEIEHGRLGRLYRSGSVLGDSRRFFMNVDAVGSDLRLIAIPNCGKGQPMQAKRMSNGGPTLRSRARLAGG